jgi:hypothetical protein
MILPGTSNAYDLNPQNSNIRIENNITAIMNTITTTVTALSVITTVMNSTITTTIVNNSTNNTTQGQSSIVNTASGFTLSLILFGLPIIILIRRKVN